MPEPDRLELLRGVVHPWHHDIFGHMNVRHYAPFFDDASFHFYSRLGLNLDEMMDGAWRPHGQRQGRDELRPGVEGGRSVRDRRGGQRGSATARWCCSCG
jgi:hypothetical protein